MGFGLIHYNAPGKTLEEFLQYASQTGFGYVELDSRDLWPEGEEHPERRAENVRHQLEALGLRASAVSANNDFVLLDEDAVAAQVKRMKRVCELAKLVGTQIVRTEGGWPKDAVPESRWAEAIAGCLKRCQEFVEPLGIRLAMDNHGQITNVAELQLDVLSRVKSPSVGLNLDTMNYRWFGHDLSTVDRCYEMVAPYVVHTHLKDGRGSGASYIGAALGEGEIHLSHATACLQRAGYRGVWCAEYEGGEEPAEGYRKCLEWMRRHLANERISPFRRQQAR